jgi:hypothetical protein
MRFQQLMLFGRRFGTFGTKKSLIGGEYYNRIRIKGACLCQEAIGEKEKIKRVSWSWTFLPYTSSLNFLPKQAGRLFRLRRSLARRQQKGTLNTKKRVEGDIEEAKDGRED